MSTPIVLATASNEDLVNELIISARCLGDAEAACDGQAENLYRQRMAAAQAELMQRLTKGIEALREIQAHHARLNERAGRPMERSLTLRMCNNGLKALGEKP